MSSLLLRRRRRWYWLLAVAPLLGFVLWQVPLLAGAWHFLQGLWRPLPDPLFVVHYLADTSKGSPAEDPALVREDLSGIVDWIVRYPGSEVFVWQLGRSDAGTTRVVLHGVVEPSKSPSRGARLAMERREHERLMGLVGGVRLSTTRHSPLAASITRILLESAPPGRQRLLLLSSDGLEESALLGDSECTPPRVDQWLRLVARHRLLNPDVLKGVRVAFLHFAPGPIDQQRCTNGPQEFLATRERWSAALKAAERTKFFTGTLKPFELDAFAKGAQ